MVAGPSQVERGSEDGGIPLGVECQEDLDRGSRLGQGHQPGGHGVLVADDASQQRAPREVDGDAISAADELSRRALGGGDDEQRVRSSALGLGASGTTGCLGHPGGDRVEAEDERLRAPAGGLEDGPTVTGPDVDDEPRVRLGQSVELADVHLDEATPDDELHGG
jgi:hypothetical protein